MNQIDSSNRTLEIAETSWHTIRPHLNRDAVIVVSAEEDLRNVAERIADDDTERVSQWIENGTLAKPTSKQIEEWNGAPTREFQCAIVQPFVLMQVPAL